ncbi:GM23211 [Drosophila sechellia]|uniref:GM23211 n=1 Tax=Drosophila sechellia TaxID=7238 RepID=B4IN64_DROSE|nr:GM23211 [Drosophila sechellia]
MAMGLEMGMDGISMSVVWVWVLGFSSGMDPLCAACFRCRSRNCCCFFVAVAFYANVRYVLLTKRIKRLHKSVQQPSIPPDEESEFEYESTSELQLELQPELGSDSGFEPGTKAISMP